MSGPRPVLRVLRGRPDDTELAALLAALAVLARDRPFGQEPGSAAVAGREWAQRAALLGAAARHGRGAWRGSRPDAGGGRAAA